MVLLIFSLTLVCYWPALRGELLWDDPAHVTKPELRSWSGLGRIWSDVRAAQQYYPVLHTAFWIEHQLWGDETIGYHLLNVVLHASACCLLALVLRKLWTHPSQPRAASLAGTRFVPAGTEWFAALLFAVHPMSVESVAWISEQKNTLSLVFYLSAALVYWNFSEHRRARTYGVATILFLLALGSKTMTATLPATLLVVLWWKNGNIRWRRDVIPLLPWFMMAAAAGLLTAWVERHVVGAEGVQYDLSLAQRVLLAGRIIWFYVGQLVWPADLAFFYQRWNVAVNAVNWFGYLVATIGVTAAFFSIRRRSRSPLAIWLLFTGALFPALGFFNVYPFIFSYVADHFQYLASVALIAGAAGGVARLLALAPAWLQNAGRVVCGITIIALAVLTYRQSGLYRENETLFRATIAKTPDSWMAHHILGFTLAKSGDPARREEAIRHFREALRFNPDSPDAHFGLGVELARLPGRKSEAIEHYEQALQLRPHYAEAHNNLAVELAKLPDRLPEVIAHCEMALLVRPSFAEAHANLADALARLPGRTSDAVGHYEEALHFKPHYPEAHNGLGYELAKLPGRMNEAILHFEEALRQKPDYSEAHFNLANALADAGRIGEATSHYEAALNFNPNSAAIHYNLAGLLANVPSRMTDAITHYEAAIRLKPDSAEIHASFATVLAILPGRLEEAIAHGKAALEIDPSLAWVHHNLSFHLSQISGREMEAISHAEAALRLKPDYVLAHNQLAVVYAQLNQFERAKSHWERALRIDPNYEAARINLRLLEQSATR